MRTEKWDFYINSLQGHPSVAHTQKTYDGLKFILDWLPLGKVLCIGCADGNEVRALNELGYQTIGITLGKTNIEWAKQNLPNCDIRLMDMHDLEFQIETFDCVYSDQCFEHCFSPFIHLLEVWHVLKPNGRFYINTPKFEWSDHTKSTISNQLNYHHPNMLHPQIFRQMFKETGFIIEREEDEHIWLLRKDRSLSYAHESIKSCMDKRKDLKCS